MKNISLLGDPSDHGGSLVSHNQDGSFNVGGVVVCANGCNHDCPIPGHGVTPVSAVTVKSFINGKLIVTSEAVAGCGAKIVSPDRKVYCE